ncbi:hypothetical protein [Roseobacter sp.]|uniref:hypothetical protein n=1 Tax=Roseobacter sp. TaxID=1907202 RepID=UPI002965F205|nr:hypothetical protein [Roseobacter sp.]MDW3181740.1 hypothetical protein [Roseobacter sp.]
MTFFPSPGEMRAIRENARKEGEAARMMADDGDAVSPGNFYTVSKSFDQGDRSWIDDFWEVITVNGPKAYVKIHTSSGREVCRFFEISNRAWYLANDAWEQRPDQGK